MTNNKIRVAITQGDANGIGYELIFKAFAEPEMLELCTPIIYGSHKIASYHRDALQLPCQFGIIKDAREARDGRLNLVPCCDEVKVEFGKTSDEATKVAGQALNKALADSHEGLFDVLVCGPVNKGAKQIKDNNIQHLYISDIARIALASNGGINEAAGQISQESIAAKVKTLHATLKRDYRISNPRLAVLALNPKEGNEEKEIIAPAIASLTESGVQVFGPYQTDDFFAARKYEAFDAILAMYRAQTTKAVKELCETDGIVALTNTSLICTLPDTDARYDIAGQNVADEAAMRKAIYGAIDMFRYRKEYDEPMANPLPKLYHERPDNGEKLRFSIPKKKEE